MEFESPVENDLRVHDRDSDPAAGAECKYRIAGDAPRGQWRSSSPAGIAMGETVDNLANHQTGDDTMRKTDTAAMLFRQARAEVSKGEAGDPLIEYSRSMATGWESMAEATKDVYDKLDAMDRKLDALIVGVRDLSRVRRAS